MKRNRKNSASLLTVSMALLTALSIGMTPGLSFASGGSGSGGSGGGGGGSSQTYALNSFKVTAGYRPGGGASGAVWTSYSVTTPANIVPIVHLTIVNTATGQVVYNITSNIASQTVDDDFVPFSTTFFVKLDLLDYSGAVMASNSATVTTPAPKTQP